MSKNAIPITVSFLFSIAAFVIGFTISNNKINKPDAYLAYQHFYEVTKDMLNDTTLLNNESWKSEIQKAELELDSVLHSEVLEWPLICDERDQLSDVIRFLYDHSDTIGKCNIDEALIQFTGKNISGIEKWAYAY